MAGFENEPLRYYPMESHNTHGMDFSAPIKAYQDHQKDLLAQKQAEQAMQLRQQAQADEMRRGGVADQQRAIGMQREERHTNTRDALYAKQEDRRQGEVLFNRNKLTKAEHEQLLHDLYFPEGTPNTPEYIARQQYAAAALQRAGYSPPKPIIEDDPNYKGPVTNVPEVKVTPAGPSKPMTPQQKALDAQLNGIDETYSKGLGVAPGVGDAPKPGYIPGRKLDVAKSTELLSADDPLNKL